MHKRFFGPMPPPTSTMAAGDRLSELPDDLIRRVLYFAPVREAASTSALSWRFRSVWRSTGAVNLEVRVAEYVGSSEGQYEGEKAILLSQRRAFLSAAKAALKAADVPVTRLTLRVEGRRDHPIEQFLYCDDGNTEQEAYLVDRLLSCPEARQLEELRVAAVEDNKIRYDDCEVRSHAIWICLLSLGTLPSETLRVLDLTNCTVETSLATVVFPRLASLRLELCTVPLEHLQRIIHAAPGIASIHLETVALWEGEESRSNFYDVVDDTSHPPPLPKKKGDAIRLCCATATALVLDRCGWKSHEGDFSVEIDAPRLRRFRYKGLLRRLSLSPMPTELARADLHFIPNSSRGKDPRHVRLFFWQFLQDFRSSVTELKLVVPHLEDIAVITAAERSSMLRPFRSLVRLELEGVHRPKANTAAVAIANLLRCCPVVRDLRINLVTAKGDSYKRYEHVREFSRKRSRDEFDNSMEHFLRRRLLSLGGDGNDDDGVEYGEDSDINPALTKRSFQCLQTSLTSLSLRFQPEKTDCFGTKLIKFFAENALVLEEMRIDDGNARMYEHMNNKVERLIANLSHKRKTGLLVALPLQRWN